MHCDACNFILLFLHLPFNVLEKNGKLVPESENTLI